MLSNTTAARYPQDHTWTKRLCQPCVKNKTLKRSHTLTDSLWTQLEFLFWNAYSFDAIWKKWLIITSCEAERHWWRKTQIMTKWLLWYDWKNHSHERLKSQSQHQHENLTDFYWFHPKIKRKICMKKPLQKMKNRHFLVSKIWSCFSLDLVVKYSLEIFKVDFVRFTHF